jgi:hypothetical protein
MNGPVPKNRVAGLMDVIDETEGLYYIDDGTPMETSEKNPSASVPEEARINLLPDGGQGSGSKASDPIELGSSEIERRKENLSRSPPPKFEEAENMPRKQPEVIMLWIPKVTTPFCSKMLVHFFALLSL